MLTYKILFLKIEREIFLNCLDEASTILITKLYLYFMDKDFLGTMEG